MCEEHARHDHREHRNRERRRQQEPRGLERRDVVLAQQRTRKLLGGRHPTRLVTHALVAGVFPVRHVQRPEPGPFHVRGAHPGQPEVEREPEILRCPRPELELRHDPAGQHHARAPQTDEEAEPAPTARHQHSLQCERRQRRLLQQTVAEGGLAAGLQRLGTAGQRALALVEETGLDDRVGVDHHHRVPLPCRRRDRCRPAGPRRDRAPRARPVREPARPPSGRSPRSRRCSDRRSRAVGRARACRP